MVVWAAALVVRRWRRGGMDGDDLLIFFSLRRLSGKAGEGQAGHTSLSQFIDNDSEGVLRCYLRPGVDSHVGGFGREGLHSEFDPATVVLGTRGHGESFAHSLGR
jgi:hypothetical protein